MTPTRVRPAARTRVAAPRGASECSPTLELIRVRRPLACVDVRLCMVQLVINIGSTGVDCGTRIPSSGLTGSDPATPCPGRAAAVRLAVMAIIHQAELQPTKLELLEEWLPRQPWFPESGTSGLSKGSYRFDDPAGEVGIETMTRLCGGSTVQVPLTYRPSP